MTTAPGREFGRYTLLRALGRGGMGTVFEAMLHGPGGFEKRVAVKLLSDGLPATAVEQLAQEARIGGRLKHPNLVDTYDFGVVDGRPYLAMEIVDGATLTVIARQGPLAPPAWLDLAQQLCRGLEALHAATDPPWVHRDLKPGNVLVHTSGLAKIGDFGISLPANLAGGELAGTLGYMAPEQLVRSDLDARADLFSLAVVLVELATGARLVVGSPDERRARTARLAEELARDGTWAVIEGRVRDAWPLLEACLQPDRDRRPGSAAALGAALGALSPTERPTPETTLAARVAQARGGPRSLPPRPVGELEATSDRPRSQTASQRTRPTERMVGRERESAALLELVRSTPVVTVKGPAGVGKTRLVVHLAHDAAARFERVVWVSLAEATTSPGVEVAVARALGSSDRTGSIGDRLVELGRALVVLDQADRVAAAVAALADDWCARAPELRVVTTSRTVGAPGVGRWLELGPLGRRDASELLLQRATARGARWEAGDEVTALAEALDGLPLALELAAARANVATASQLLARLTDRFRLLAGSEGGERPTLRAALESSYHLLGPAERSALNQLSVFRGGFRLADAERVLDLSAFPGDPWVMDVLDQLWRASMVRTTTVHGQTRFSLLESVRVFAAERLEAEGGALACRLRHARTFAQLEQPWGALGALPVREQLLELDNLIAAYTTARQEGEVDLAARLVLVSNDLVRFVAPLEPAIARTSRLLQHEPPPSPALKARLWLSRSVLERLRRNYRAAKANLEPAIEVFRTLGERRFLAIALLGLGAVHRSLGDRDAARAAALAARDLAAALGAAGLEGAAGHDLALLSPLEEWEPMLEAALRAVASDPQSDPSISAAIANNLVVCTLECNQPDRAARHAALAMRLVREHRLSRMAAATCFAALPAWRWADEPAPLRTATETAERLVDELSDLPTRIDLRLSSAIAWLSLGEWARAQAAATWAAAQVPNEPPFVGAGRFLAEEARQRSGSGTSPTALDELVSAPSDDHWGPLLAARHAGWLADRDGPSPALGERLAALEVAKTSIELRVELASIRRRHPSLGAG